MLLSKSLETSLTFISMHYTKCPVAIREFWVRVFQNPLSRKRFYTILKDLLNTQRLEIVWILTCNRCDVAVMERVTPMDFQEAIHQFCLLEGIPSLQGDIFLTHGTYYHGQEALYQVMRIASSLDSLVLGESQILGQLKQSFALSHREGFCGRCATQVFQACFHAAKRVRKETHLGYHGVSIGHAAVQMVLRVFEQLSDIKILIIGSGQMARIAAQHALSQGAKNISIANRTFLNAENLAKRIGHQSISLPLNEALNNIHQWQAILVATSSDQPILLFEHFNKPKPKTQVVVDMSLPRNVESHIAQLEDVFLFDVDSLQGALVENKTLRQEAALRAELILKEELSLFQYSLNKRKHLQNVGRFHKWVYQIVEKEVNKSLKKGKIEPAIIAKAVAKKLSAGPVSAAKGLNPFTDNRDNETLGSLFSLTDPPSIGEPETNPKSRDAS